MNIRTTKIKRGILFFWAAYYAIICFSNVLELLKDYGILPKNPSHVPGFFVQVKEVLNVLSFANHIPMVLFVGFVLWEGINAFLFWQAFAAYDGKVFSKVNLAFVMSIALSLAFVLVVKGFLEITIMIVVLLILLSLGCWLFIRLLPERK